MTTNLRISLTILSIGFAVEGGAEAYSLLTAGSFLPGTSLLFLLPSVVTLLGLLFLLIGRHEWDELHRARVRRANQIFGLSLLAGVVAGAELVLLTVYPSVGSPLWAEALFGAAVGSFVLGTFVTYAQLVFHLVTRPSKGVLIASSLWALVVSAFVAQALAADLPTILGDISARSFSVESLIGPVDYLASYLFISYFLLLAAYLDAHVAVARGRPAAPSVNGPPSATPPPTSPGTTPVATPPPSAGATTGPSGGQGTPPTAGL
ncbi:MAG: hypothetical protein WBS16_04920 [Thermoplasmata archaeon]